MHKAQHKLNDIDGDTGDVEHDHNLKQRKSSCLFQSAVLPNHMGAVLGQVLAILHQPEALQILEMSQSGICSTPTSRSVVDMLIRSYLHTMFHKVKHMSNANMTMFAAENKRILATVTRLDGDSECDSAEPDSSSGNKSSDSDSESDGSDGNELEDEV